MSKNDEESVCFPSNLESSVTLTKKSLDCEEIDLNWEVSFGVELELRVITQCEGECNTNFIAYGYNKYIKNAQGIDTIAFETSGFYARCGEAGGFNQTLNTELGDSQEYFVGDTIVYEISIFRACPAFVSDGIECINSNLVLLEHPTISDFYVVDESDFYN